MVSSGLFGRGRLVVPERLLGAVRDHVAASHPHEAGGYLVCERRDALQAVDHVPLDNEAEEPRRRFVTTVERPPPRPRVFYHSHTSPASPSDLTRLDRKIPEEYLLVVFAPHGDPYGYRLFRRGTFGWRELSVESEGPERDSATRLPRLV